jgi:hypothetical protein
MVLLCCCARWRSAYQRMCVHSIRHVSKAGYNDMQHRGTVIMLLVRVLPQTFEQ